MQLEAEKFVNKKLFFFNPKPGLTGSTGCPILPTHEGTTNTTETKTTQKNKTQRQGSRARPEAVWQTLSFLLQHELSQLPSPVC